MKLNLSTFFQVERPFANSAEIRGIVRQLSGSSVEAERAELLLFFSTTKQQSWFVSTPKNLYCITDKIDNPSPNVKWAMGIERAIPAKISVKNTSEKSGYISIADEKPRMFSRKLFTDFPIEVRLKSLLKKSTRRV